MPILQYEPGTTAENALHMQPGSMLADRYLIGKVIGYGGFGVTYITWDQTQQQRAAIKEYLPSELAPIATRAVGQSQGTPFGISNAERFNGGMVKFAEEAIRLAQLKDELGIERVFDSFESNNSAYIVMEYLDGETLTSYLERESKIPADKAIEMLMPVIQSLEAVHKAGIIHGGISPNNIMIAKDGQLRLTDYTAKLEIEYEQRRRYPQVFLLPDQYSPWYIDNCYTGPHTDVYVLGAVLYKMLTGIAPRSASERFLLMKKRKTTIIPPSKYCNIGKNQENAILNAMNVKMGKRTTTAAILANQVTSLKRFRRRCK